MNLDDLRGDPVLGPLVERLEQTSEELRGTKAKLAAHEQRLEGQEDTRLRDRYIAQLAVLEEHHHRRYGRKLDREKFIDYAVGRRVADLGVAYNSFSLGDEIELAKQEARERGRERGHREAGRSSEWGAPRIRPPHLEGIESLQDLSDEQVLADPEMRRGFLEL